jgi:hypothetical protein
MSTQPITPRLAESMNRRLLAASQLQIQAARSVALDASALGVIAVDIAVATIAFGAGGAHGLWILALVLLGLSLGQAVRSLRLPARNGSAPPSRSRRTLSRAGTSTPPRTRFSTTSRKTSNPTNAPWPARSPRSTGR